MNQQTLNQLMIEQIADLYDAEKQLTKALPKMAKAAASEDLSQALQNHLEETTQHVSRLEQIFNVLGVPAKGKTCKAMKGLIEEGKEVMEEHPKGELRDLAMIAGGQRIEHYEISAYGTARTLAEHLDLQEAVELLDQTLAEESAADSKLSEVASSIYEVVEDQTEASADEDSPSSVSAKSAKAAKPPARRAVG